jgi:hypothetical protein
VHDEQPGAAGPWDRSLRPEEQATVEAARRGAALRYEGRVVPHRSCGIAIAETFGRATAPYQSLRRGGLTGRGECGTRLGGRLVLGELLGDPDPGGPTRPLLREAVDFYEARWAARCGVEPAPGASVCNALVEGFVDFKGPARARFCEGLAAETAALLAETLLRAGVVVEPVAVSIEDAASEAQ